MARGFGVFWARRAGCSDGWRIGTECAEDTEKTENTEVLWGVFCALDGGGLIGRDVSARGPLETAVPTLAGLCRYGFIVILSVFGAGRAMGVEGRLDLESPVFAGSSRPALSGIELPAMASSTRRFHPGGHAVRA